MKVFCTGFSLSPYLVRVLLSCGAFAIERVVALGNCISSVLIVLGSLLVWVGAGVISM